MSKPHKNKPLQLVTRSNAPVAAPTTSNAPPPNPPQLAPLSYTQKVLIAVSIAAAAILLAVLVYVTVQIVVLCFAGLLLAIFLSAPSDLLAKHTGIKRVYALIIVLATFILLALGGGYYMGSTITKQSKELARTLPMAFTQFEKDLAKRLASESPATAPAATSSTPMTAPSVFIEGTESSAIVAPTNTSENWFVEKLAQIRDAATEFLFSESFVQHAGGVAGGVVSSTFGIIGDLVVVAGVGLFLAINPRLYSHGLVTLFPKSHRPRTAAILAEVGGQLQWWFVGQLCSMASIALLTFIGLAILGVPMAATLAILAGLMNFIPNFGPILAAAPAVLIAFAPEGDSTQLRSGLAGWVILMYIIIQLLEGWVITPFFQQRAVEIPPALIIVSQVVFALLLGPIGLVLATPMLAAVLAIVRMAYIEDILGDRSAKPK